LARNKRRVEWGKVMEVLLILLVLPTVGFYLIGRAQPVFLSYAYYFLVGLFIFQAGLSYLYSLSAFKRKQFKELPAAKHVPLPKTTFIVSAYLPNEIEVIEATLLNILERIQRPEAGLEVILAYNAPHMEGIEPRLRELAYKWPQLILANAYGSRGKSENLNYALEIASGEMIVLLDADHVVSADCLRRAWRWLDEGYNVVQGRCKIRNGNKSPISALVEVEFEAIYGISHFAKSKLFDSALFGGTNGYWRSSTIKDLKFDPQRLTEDIDATLRAILKGNHIVHDRSIISSELAPETLGGLWFQRKRWAQGWFQCSVRYQIAVFKSKFLNIFQKFMWTTLLMWRVIYDILSHLLFPVVFAFWLTRGKIELPMNNFIWFALFFVMLSGPFESLVAYKNAAPPRAPVWHYFYYAFFAFWYTLFKNTIQIVAIRDELLGKQEWVVSARRSDV
jgi:cellulose synthase/poly-beta-1,6-N-acetylglucosamine synthase-like glycosyltransferase